MITRIPVGHPAFTDTAQMVRALHAASHAPNGVHALWTLASGGWAVFPVPVGKKFDSGPGALTYADATTDPAVALELARDVMYRHGVRDVNVACSPWRSRVPLVGIDLDGPAAVAAFAADHPEASCSTLRVRTAGKGGGMHVYVSRVAEPMVGTNPWGGEYRAIRGHLMMPGSTIGGSRAHYTPAGTVFLAGLRLPGATDAGEGPGAPAIRRAEVEDVVTALSGRPPRPWAARTMEGRLAAIAAAPVGTRYRAMVSAVAHAVRLAHRGALPLRWALGHIENTYTEAVAGEPRDPGKQVTDVVAWVLGQEYAA